MGWPLDLMPFVGRKNNLCGILFASLEDGTLQKGGSTLTGKNLFLEEQILNLKSCLIPIEEGGKYEKAELLPLKV